jgi:outer membrane protein assembly factor BamD
MERSKWLVLVILFAGAGCATKNRLSADEYFKQASLNLRDGAYELAVEQYRELLDQHPFSEYSEEAELKIAHAHYLKGSCREAIATLSDFQRRHPTSPYLPLVGYLLGRCYEAEIRPPDRDQSASQSAHAYYLAIAQQHPNSPFADLAREQLNRCRESLAGHEYMVAKFYARRGNAKAAEYRLLDLLNRFEDTDMAAEALYALGQLYREDGERERAKLAFAAVSYHHPNHDIASDAKRALAKLVREEDPPRGDPLVVLKAQSGRTRSLALAQVVELPEPGTSPAPAAGFGPPLGAGGGPFGGRY